LKTKNNLSYVCSICIAAICGSHKKERNKKKMKEMAASRSAEWQHVQEPASAGLFKSVLHPACL